MLIQDLNFFEPIELDRIQGGIASKAKSMKPGASAKAVAVGDKKLTKASTKKSKGKAPIKSKAASDLMKEISSIKASDLMEIDILELDELFSISLH